MYVERVGLDPEVAVIDQETGLARSAHKFLNRKRTFTFYRDSDKEKKTGGVKGSEIERDGAAIEVRSIVPSACRDNIIPYLAEGLRQAQLLVESKGNFSLSSVPKYVLDEVSLEGEFPDDIIEFGCRPDIDAYSLGEKDPVCEPDDLRRWTGGHLHMSPLAADASVKDAAAWAVLFDYAVAAPLVAILGEAFGDGEAERREFYGQPGSFRFEPKKRKVEFRTLSGRVLLHPTLLYWAVGAMKMMALQADRPQELLKSLSKVVSTQSVFETVSGHDVAAATELMPRIYGALPRYKADKTALANQLGGGGNGAYNPFFFEKVVDVFVEANRRGITFKDDLKWNWGLYEDYEPKHHAYWGVQSALVGALDDNIFPQNEVLKDLIPTPYLMEEPVYTHPTVGGAHEYVTSGAVNWLR